MPSLSPESKLSSVAGGKTAQAIRSAFGYETVGELLAHYPRRYASRGDLTQLTELPLGETVTVVAQILDVRERSMQARRGGILEVRITDGTGMLTLTFFNQQWRARELQPGRRGMFAGKVGEYRGALQLAHPAYELFPEDDEAKDEVGEVEERAQAWALRPIPIYPASSQVTSWTIARVMALILEGLAQEPEFLPEAVRVGRGLLPHDAAIRQIHRPETEEEWREARRTLRYEEAFLLQLALLVQRRDERRVPAVARRRGEQSLVPEFDAQLPFVLTPEQVEIGAVIAEELEHDVPMHRLVQGEVGSGKTIVAIRAMLQVAESGGQSALLAPTEVLAAQHLRSILRALGPKLAARLSPTLITGQLSAAEKKKALLAAASGTARIVVGTHALMSEQTQFADLGLIVIDEQHRFGVEQREQLRRKASFAPHQLVLTATPIPRTVALTAFGDLDVSTMRNVPAGRAGILSHVVPTSEHPGWEERAWQRAAEEVAAGRQVFVVCPAIDSEDISSVTETLDFIRSHSALKHLRSAALTGAMSRDEKEETMTAFANAELDLLVATTVIEVGVDVPNATMMIIRDAERFGVSQLHQLRGRVGRGAEQGLCIFVTAAEQGSIGRARVEAVAETTDGFVLAERDLELRQEGDVLGAAQSGGRSSLRLLRVARDTQIIEDAHDDAQAFLSELADSPLPVQLQSAIAEQFGSATENLEKS